MMKGECTMTKQTNAAGWYGGFFKAWQVKLLGPKPTEAMLDTIHKLGARPGKQALANAMALRECGVTGSQIVIACGAPQLNKMRGFISDGLLKREAVPAAGNHTVYKLTLTAKGAARTKAAEAKSANVAKPAKAKAAPKPRRAKPAKVTEAPAPVATAEAAEANAQPQA